MQDKIFQILVNRTSTEFQKTLSVYNIYPKHIPDGAIDKDINFITPEVTESGRFVQVIVNLPASTATVGQIIRGQVMIKGRFI